MAGSNVAPRARLIGAFVFSLALGACGAGAPDDAPPADGLASTLSRLTTENGRQLNGRQLNGRQLNGRQLNGRQLNGRQLNGPELNLRSITGMWSQQDALVSLRLEGSALVAITADGTELRGEALVGAHFEVAHQHGPDEELRIDAVEAQGDVFIYSLSGRRGAKWTPLCGEDAEGAIGAIALAGAWDTSSGTSTGGDHLDDPARITFACQGYALAKCVEIGYRPWVGGGRGLHQACTRALRADYCGDGRSFTINGEVINLYDGAGIQQDTEDWQFEAEWDGEGARCVSAGRRAAMSQLPACATALELPQCGDVAHFAEGTLLMTEFDASVQ